MLNANRQTLDRFIPGIVLNEGFFHDVVKPLIARHYPDLRYSSALIGYGSDVLGLDTAISMDHNWGPRLQIFLTDQDFPKMATPLDTILRERLPVAYKGFPTNYTDKRADLTQSMRPIAAGPVNHLIEIHTLARFGKHALGVDVSQEFSLLDWLTLPEQGLLEFTQGKVYDDGLRQLNRLRARFAFYPKDIWLIKMAALWHTIGEEETFVGRCHDLGDEIGERLILARLVNYVLKLCFYLEQQYPPYSKWLGTAFRKLRCAPALSPILAAILSNASHNTRAAGLFEAYEIIGQMHHALNLTEKVAFTVSNFYGRPYQVLFAERIADSLKAAISDQSIKAANLVLAGIGQLTDGVDKRGLYDLVRSFYKRGTQHESDNETGRNSRHRPTMGLDE